MLFSPEHPYDCASEHKNETCKCLVNNKEIEVSWIDVKMKINKDNYQDFFDAVRNKINERGAVGYMPDYKIFELANICPMFLFDEDVLEVWSEFSMLYKRESSPFKSVQEMDNNTAAWVNILNSLWKEYDHLINIREQELINKR
jgi:hypothetical protein